jgi:NAD(P)-dependent dehydrogenase (short-subunit alcohol dehydrogenase family)
MTKPLTGQVALVAGATRGAGRGIARALGEAGAVVYCTGRSVRGQRSPYGRPETIDETAEMITAAGGAAIPIRVDHTVASEVQALVERIDREQGRIDVLVFLESESALFVGRAVAALAADPNVLDRSGQLLSSWELAREFKFTDSDGRRPDWGALAIDWSGLPPAFVDVFTTGTRVQIAWLESLATRTRAFAAKLPTAAAAAATKRADSPAGRRRPPPRR